MPASPLRYFVMSDLYRGELLKEQLDSGDLEFDLDIFSESQAVYMWLKRISPPDNAIGSATAFSDWVQKALHQVDGVVQGKIGHLGRVEFTLGRAPISFDKLDDIKGLANSYTGRRTLQKLFSNMDFNIALYVGETSDLPRRAREHLRGTTDFSKRVFANGFSWENLAMRFFLLPPDTTSRQRQALERVVASMLLAPATSRAG